MLSSSLRPEVPPESERLAVIASPQRTCRVCGALLEGRKREACSDRCRAALSRRRLASAQARWEAEVRETLPEIARLAQLAGRPI
jgi:predicted nucleic acid-binding Zn ribbon protein